tara:strand:+ start:1469 stop:1654 length:186 start_codon:yes stop_codon:yes gene_type:complete
MLNKHQATGPSTPPNSIQRFTGIPLDRDSKYITKINTQLKKINNTQHLIKISGSVHNFRKL